MALEDFAGLISTANRFLGALARNNDRAWFEPRKAEYEASVRGPGLLLGQALAHDLDRMRGPGHVCKLFRVNRDLRFSKDRRPYKAHLHMLIRRGPEQGPAFFLGIEPGKVTAGAGMFGFPPGGLDRFREAVAGPAGAALAAFLAEREAAGDRLGEEDLKRVPKPWDGAHPRAGLLRRKSLTLWRDLDPEEADPAPRARTAAVFEAHAPLVDWLAERVAT